VNSGRGGGRSQNSHGGRNQGRGRGGRGGGCNIYMGTYFPDQWHALSAKVHKRVAKGRKQFPGQVQGSGAGAGVSVSQAVTGQQRDSDIQLAITMWISTINNNQRKRADAENAGSSMTRRHLMVVSMSYRIQNRHITANAS
jgi:hypothetical protein